MDALIGDLLDLARLDEPATADIEKLVDLSEVCSAAAERLPATDVAVTMGPGESVVVRGVETQLERAVFNVLTNATQHARQSVRVQIRSSNGRAEIVIDDDGPGIAVADRQRIFDRFVRLDEARSRSTGGAGIGLALVKAIATKHRGSVTVTQAPQLGGARFVLDLPDASQRRTI